MTSARSILGHVEDKVTAGSVLKGIVGVGVLLPANIILPGSGQLLGAGLQGVENRFNRDQERDADRLGLQYAKAAGHDPAAALVLLDALQEKAPDSGIARFLDIHPPYPERRTRIEAELASQPQSPARFSAARRGVPLWCRDRSPLSRREPGEGLLHALVDGDARRPAEGAQLGVGEAEAVAERFDVVGQQRRAALEA